MKQEIKHKERQERQTYVPASVKVINVTAHKVMCTSPGSVSNPFGSTDEEDI